MVLMYKHNSQFIKNTKMYNQISITLYEQNKNVIYIRVNMNRTVLSFNADVQISEI